MAYRLLMPVAMPGSIHETLLEILTLYPEGLNGWLSLVTPDVGGCWTVSDSTVRVVRPSEVRPDLVFVDLPGRRAVMLLTLLRRRGVPVDEATEARVKACTDLPTLDAWFDRAQAGGRVFVEWG